MYCGRFSSKVVSELWEYHANNKISSGRYFLVVFDEW